MPELEALFRGLLINAGARHVAVSKVEPEAPSADYLTGYRAGYEAGQLAAMALNLAALTGESPSELIEQTMAQASVDSAFPFELHIEADEGGAT